MFFGQKADFLLKKFMYATQIDQGRHGEFEPGKAQYSTPNLFDQLFLIREYWNPKSRQGPGLGAQFRKQTTNYKKIEITYQKKLLTNCSHNLMFLQRKKIRMIRLYYMYIWHFLQSVNTPLRKNHIKIPRCVWGRTLCNIWCSPWIDLDIKRHVG